MKQIVNYRLVNGAACNSLWFHAAGSVNAVSEAATREPKEWQTATIR
jgi:hypothetical protein